MASNLEQSTRIGELKTPLGPDRIALSRFDGVEGLSELFEFRVEGVATEDDLPLVDIIGKNCTVTLNTIDGGKRHFDGIATEVQWLGARESLYDYAMTLRPWLFLLSRRVNSRIFHQSTAPDIIAQIFADYGGAAVFERSGLTKSYPTLEYCVQFRETDLDFVHRLMEQHGINYLFTYGEGKHTLVLGDSNSSFHQIPGGTRPYYQLSNQHRRKEEHFHKWTPGRRLTTGKVTLNDYDFKKPGANLMVERTGDAEYNHGQIELYNAPGKYTVRGDGEQYATSSLNSLRAADGRHSAAGDCIAAQPGLTVTLEKHPTGKLNRQYIFVRCSHSFLAESYRSGGGSTSEPYRGTYEMLESDIDYAPAQRTPAPVITGPQTAKVVGQGEIDCDKYGRILVDFHWDREHQQSMRCRVAQVWAGKQWGGVFLPRIGMEVLVQFLDGDPDRPVVIGSVYNQDNMPPYALPEKNLTSGWKSQSSPDAQGYNEFVFDDSAGKELVRMHAQHDHETVVENNETRDVGVNRTTNIGTNDTLTVGQDLLVTAGNSITLRVGRSTIVMNDQSITLTSPNISATGTQTIETTAGLTSDHKAGGTMTLMAPLIKIN
ncbi:type VI secretion system tip protein VgrG [Nostoc sp. 3335mG]|nr:type VI secretion system tip protein VgrG [Nostoc sp. 3335mG]